MHLNNQAHMSCSCGGWSQKDIGSYLHMHELAHMHWWFWLELENYLTYVYQRADICWTTRQSHSGSHTYHARRRWSKVKVKQMHSDCSHSCTSLAHTQTSLSLYPMTCNSFNSDSKCFFLIHNMRCDTMLVKYSFMQVLACAVLETVKQKLT